MTVTSALVSVPHPKDTDAQHVSESLSVCRVSDTASRRFYGKNLRIKRSLHWEHQDEGLYNFTVSV
jgi:hypothetical protein